MVDGNLWHERLGHFHTTMVHKMLEDVDLFVKTDTFNNVCGTGQLCKSYRLPFINKHTRILNPFDIVHVDI